jgi:putative ABC transport system permease protein
MIPIVYNLRSLAVRKTTTFATILGLALVVFVFASVMMLANGVKKTLGRAAASDVAIVLRKGADSELQSNLDDAKVGLVASSNFIVRDGSGNPDIASEVVVVVLLDKSGTDGFSNVTVRGVDDRVLAFRKTAHVIEGRGPRAGSDEVMIGKALRGRFRGMSVGETFELRKDRHVSVVGVFDDGGSSTDSEIWADRDAVRSAFGREGLVSALRVRLASAGDLEAFRGDVEANRQLDVGVQSEASYYEKQSEGTSTLIMVLGMIVAVFAAAGAGLGAMVTMYSAVANRQKEIGTLTAIGFGSAQIVSAFLIESVMLALVGGGLGALASLGMSFVHFAVMSSATWSEIVFAFEPTPRIVLSALAFAGILGIVGGILPALRAARIRPVDALRAD